MIRAKDQYGGPSMKTEFVAKRRYRWASPQEMVERFENRPPFNSWDHQVLQDYCDHALVPSAEGFVLACPPEIEAPIYEANTAVESNIYPEIATIQIPVHVFRAGLGQDPSNLMGSSLTAPDLAVNFARGDDILLQDHSHFIPMEAPGLAAKMIADMLSLL